MKKILPVLALAGLVVPASAFANPVTPAVAPMFALSVPVPAPTTRQPIPCHTQLGTLMQKLQSAEYDDSVNANAMVMAGDQGYAESCRGTGEGFCNDGTSAKVSGGKLAGVATVTDDRSNNGHDLAFALVNVDGVAKIEWRFESKSYTGAVKSCSSGYWMASAGNSAIVIKLDKAKLVQTPE